MRSLRFFILASLTLAACSPYDPDLGPVPFLCGSAEPRCPDGYFCQPASGSGGGEYCVAPNGGMIPVDGRNSNCADDSQLEPNDSIQQAFVTPIDSGGTKKTLTFAGLAICPAGDKDTYSITISQANENLEVLIEYEAGGAVLQGSILNGGGTPIANASPVSGMTGVIRATVPNLPVGTYYAQAYGPNSGSLTMNNYKLTINVTGP